MIDRSLLLCAKLLAVYCLVMLSLSSTEAAIIYSGVQNETLHHESEQSISMNMGGVWESFDFSDIRGAFALFRSSAGSYSTSKYPSSFLVAGFDDGHLIDFTSEWSDIRGENVLVAYDEDHGLYQQGDFFDQTDRFIAIRILDDTDTFFGWIRTSHSVQDEQLIVHDWAWNDAPGEPIRAGEVPESATAAILMGLGALLVAGGVRWRRRVVN